MLFDLVNMFLYSFLHLVICGTLIALTDLENLHLGDYKIGDKVRIDLSASELKVLQSSSDIGWLEQMAYVGLK